jgi:hypothetical protein
VRLLEEFGIEDLTAMRSSIPANALVIQDDVLARDDTLTLDESITSS